MKISVDEITSLIKQELEGYEPSMEEEEVGTVVDVGDGIAKISGLSKAMFSEIVIFESGMKGIVLNLDENMVGVIVLGDCVGIYSGEMVKRTKKLLRVPVGENMIGRVVDPLGNPLDGKGPIVTTKTRPIEIIAPGIAKRHPVDTPLQTGIKAIDSMIPIGRGQRELIIGDRQTGKTAITLDTIINQKNKGVVCVYVAIGQKNAAVANVVEYLQKHGAMEYTIVLIAGASDPASLLYIVPYAGCAMAEYFMYEKGQDTLCVYDDLTKQANAYRQLSLLLQRPPGREAFPGDVFYLHSRLLERAVRLNKENGGGSLTALPIIETQEGEVAAYIPTNVVSITDGQIYLTPKLFASGIMPAIDVGISVSRVGGSAQIKSMKKVAGRLRLDMAQFRSLEAFAQMGTDLDEETQRQLNRGYALVEILKQRQFQPLDVEDQVLIIYLAGQGYFDEIPRALIRPLEKPLIRFLKNNCMDVITPILKTGVAEETDKLQKFVQDFIEQFQSKEEEG